jgi:hypothetical protein
LHGAPLSVFEINAEMKLFAAHGVSSAAMVFVLASGRGHRV